jgi:hypothetical protein
VTAKSPAYHDHPPERLLLNPSGTIVFCGADLSRDSGESSCGGCGFRSDASPAPQQPVGPNTGPGLALEPFPAREPAIGPRAEGEPGALAGPNKPLTRAST